MVTSTALYRAPARPGMPGAGAGSGGRQLYPIRPCPAGVPPRRAAASRHHFTAVEVRRRSLTVTAVADDGAVLDRTVITR
jgi:hypothetical protein